MGSSAVLDSIDYQYMDKTWNKNFYFQVNYPFKKRQAYKYELSKEKTLIDEMVSSNSKQRPVIHVIF